MFGMTRRTFIRKSAAAGAAFSVIRSGAGQTSSSDGVSKANEAIRVAVIGLGHRGPAHIEHLANVKGARVVALCDPDRDRLDAAVRKWEPVCGSLRPFVDVRRLLEQKDIDAVTIASPNYWHALMGIWACQAGKDVYVEKPVSHNIWEGRQLVRAARRYDRIVQTGTQARANPDLARAAEWIRAGHLGEVRYVHGMCYRPRQTFSPHEGLGLGPVPPSLDYDLWTGPASLQKPLARQHLHYNWHWVFDTGNGDLGNQCVHEIDIVRWLLDYQEPAPGVQSIGGRMGYADGGETPNTQLVFYDYRPAPLIFEVRGLPSAKEYHDPGEWGAHMDRPLGRRSPCGDAFIVYCEGGRLLEAGGGQCLQAVDNDDKLVRDFYTPDDRYPRVWVKATRLLLENWLEAVRSRDRAMLKADVEQGHISSALCHGGMISHRLGQLASDETIRKSIKGNTLFSKHYESFRKHLGRNGIDLSHTYTTLGDTLKMDTKAERFIGNAYANRLLTRDYRKPYVVPQEV